MGPSPLYSGERLVDADAMKKLVVAVAVLVGVGYLAKRFAPKFADVDWEQRFAAMPENAPRKWMFRNISEIHDNTERILELLEDGSEGGSEPPGSVEGNAT
jgi:hypothetical protein